METELEAARMQKLMDDFDSGTFLDETGDFKYTNPDVKAVIHCDNINFLGNASRNQLQEHSETINGFDTEDIIELQNMKLVEEESQTSKGEVKSESVPANPPGPDLVSSESQTGGSTNQPRDHYQQTQYEGSTSHTVNRFQQSRGRGSTNHPRNHYQQSQDGGNSNHPRNYYQHSQDGRGTNHPRNSYQQQRGGGSTNHPPQHEGSASNPRNQYKQSQDGGGINYPPQNEGNTSHPRNRYQPPQDGRGAKQPRNHYQQPQDGGGINHPPQNGRGTSHPRNHYQPLQDGRGTNQLRNHYQQPQDGGGINHLPQNGRGISHPRHHYQQSQDGPGTNHPRNLQQQHNYQAGSPGNFGQQYRHPLQQNPAQRPQRFLGNPHPAVTAYWSPTEPPPPLPFVNNNHTFIQPPRPNFGIRYEHPISIPPSFASNPQRYHSGVL